MEPREGMMLRDGNDLLVVRKKQVDGVDSESTDDDPMGSPEVGAWQQADRAGVIILEGQQQNCPQTFAMGEYLPMEPVKFVNGRVVWRKVDGVACYAYFAVTKRWFISDEADMRSGKGTGWLRSADEEPDALTPDQIKPPLPNMSDAATGAWVLCGGWELGNAGDWVKAPTIRMRQVSEGRRSAKARASSPER
jgi:hypothetical protein